MIPHPEKITEQFRGFFEKSNKMMGFTMSKKQTLLSTNSNSPDWMTISEAVEMTNTKRLGIKKK